MKTKVLPGAGKRIVRGVPTSRSEPLAQSDFGPWTLRRTIPSVRRVSALDIAAIEARARALRATAVAEMVSNAWNWLATYFERERRRRDAEYLARARNLAEREDRLRKLERHRQLLHV